MSRCRAHSDCESRHFSSYHFRILSHDDQFYHDGQHSHTVGIDDTAFDKAVDLTLPIHIYCHFQLCCRSEMGLTM